MDHTLVSIADISALAITSFTLPNHFAYATSVSGWFDMYMRRNADFSATGSDIVSVLCEFVSSRYVESDTWSTYRES
jgi:hypothetical protein